MIFLIGNKSDLDAQRDVTYEEAKQFADENGLMFVEASAKTLVHWLEVFKFIFKFLLSKTFTSRFSGDNVEEAFLETAKKIFQSIQDGRYILFQV